MQHDSMPSSGLHSGLQVAQAGSQGDKQARRVLSLRAHHLKENLLKAKTDLRVHKAACRHQAYRIGQLHNDTPTSSRSCPEAQCTSPLCRCRTDK